MGEWFTTFFLVPAILVPVVVLMSFAGCDQCWGLIHVDPAKPTIDEAKGTDAFTIHLAWHFSSAAENFHFTRTDPKGNSVDFSPLGSPHDDADNLAPNTTYDYQVQAVYSNGDTSEFSTVVAGTTRPFTSAYSKPLIQTTGFLDGGTLIQRIEASHLSATGRHVRITVQASRESDAWIDRVYLSKASTTGKEWDADTNDLTKIYDASPFVVTKGTEQELPITKYTIDQSQALLIAIDFTPGPASGVSGPTSRVGSAPGIPRSEATAYFLQPGAEAASPTRSPNYFTQLEDPTNPNTSPSYMICVTNIEVDSLS